MKKRCHSLNVCEIDRDNVDTVKFLSAQHVSPVSSWMPVPKAPVIDTAIRVTLLPSSALYCSTLPLLHLTVRPATGLSLVKVLW